MLLNSATDLSTPAQDSVNNNDIREVVGNKTDAAQTVVGITRSLVAYCKGILNQLAILIGYSAAIGPQVALQTGNEYLATYSLPNGVAENTAFDFNTQFAGLAGRRIKAIAIFLDLVNLTQSCTVRVKVAIDGATLRTISALNWTTAMDDGIYFDMQSCNINFSVTLQSAVAEGGARDVAVRVVFEQMEQ